MAASQSLPDLVAAAQAKAKTHEDRISELLGAGTDAQSEEISEATLAIELIAVDIFSVFEARMQHHFKRGPLSRKLKALLLEAKKPDLAGRLHQYYLAMNVLKHGTGASYRELINAPTSLLVVKPVGDGAHSATGLVDVSAPGFFDGLATTILEAFQFLEKRKGS